MITTELYFGQGLGNQLWAYISTRVLAKDKGYEFGIKSPEKFKGADFMDIDFGKEVRGGTGPQGGPPETLPEGITNYYDEPTLLHPISGADIRQHDPAFLKIPDNTKIDGLLQDEQYIIHRKKEIREWLAVKKEHECFDYSNDDTCIINFRGSGYVQDKDFFLPPRYWRNAIKNMRKINPNFKFVVVSEDVATAKKFFPHFDVFHWDIGKDYVVIKNAHYLIMSNSSFAWFPAWTSTTLKYCIAPKYWGRHNISDGYWSLDSNITKGWMYQDRNGNLFDYDTCSKELQEYKKKHADIYSGKVAYIPSLTTHVRNFFNIWATLSKDTNVINALCHTAFTSVFKIYITARKNIKRIKTKIKPLTGAPWVEETRLFELLKDRMNVVFDVGPRDDLSYYAIKNDAVYHLFEPNTTFIKALKKKRTQLEKQNIKINEYGLADKSGDNFVYYEKSQGFMICPYYPEGDEDTGTRYSLRKLDDYVKENNIKHIDFLKIDAEGFDHNVLVGAEETIKANKISFVQWEYWENAADTVNLVKNNFDLYLAMDPRLLDRIYNIAFPVMSPEEKKIDFEKSLIPLTPTLVDLITRRFGQMGLYGNIFGINKSLKFDVQKLMFDVKKPQKRRPQGDYSRLGILKSKTRSKIKDVTILNGYY